MSTKREPLYTKEDLLQIVESGFNEIDTIRIVGAVRIANLYEAARAKDAELIQKLVNALHWYVEEDDVLGGLSALN